MEYNKEKKEIITDRELSNLDKLVLKFIKILEKHVDYVIISGYVSILLGRSRATEDVDVFINKIHINVFSKLYDELINSGFWCLNAEKVKDIYSFLEDGLAVRFSEEGKPVPNFEVKFPKRDVDKETFNDFIIVKLNEGKLKISSLERQIAFKRYYLCSDKDIEDALHIEKTFKNQISFKEIERLKNIIERIKKDEKNKKFFTFSKQEI